MQDDTSQGIAVAAMLQERRKNEEGQNKGMRCSDLVASLDETCVELGNLFKQVSQQLRETFDSSGRPVETRK